MLSAVIVGDHKLAEYRAYNFCQKASQKQSYQEVKQLIKVTYGINPRINLNSLDKTSSNEGYVIVIFLTMFPAYYACVLGFDVSNDQKPITNHVFYKD